MAAILTSAVAALALLAPATGSASLWSPRDSPAIADYGDGAAVELGLELSSDVDVQVAGVRFYKAAANAGPHVVSVWTGDGALLGRATTGAESARGWQEARLDPPVAIRAGTAFVASYHAPAGRYPVDARYFAERGRDAVPLHAPAGTGGRFAYGSTPTFPTESFEGNHYWVDVTVVRVAPPPPLRGVAAAALSSAATRLTPAAR